MSFSAAAAIEGVHPETIRNWALRGVKHPSGRTIKLNTIRVGGRSFTTRSWLDQFRTELNGRMEPAIVPPARRSGEMTPARRWLYATGVYGKKSKRQLFGVSPQG